MPFVSVALDFLRTLQNMREVDARIFLHNGLASSICAGGAANKARS